MIRRERTNAPQVHGSLLKMARAAELLPYALVTNGREADAWGLGPHRVANTRPRGNLYISGGRCQQQRDGGGKQADHGIGRVTHLSPRQPGSTPGKLDRPFRHKQEAASETDRKGNRTRDALNHVRLAKRWQEPPISGSSGPVTRRLALVRQNACSMGCQDIGLRKNASQWRLHDGELEP